MSIEGGPSCYDSYDEEVVPAAEISPDDEALEAAVHDPESSRRLFDADPVTWVRAAVAADTKRGASAVSNYELAVRHSNGGFAEWDPRVAQSVRNYLSRLGFVGLRGSSQED